MQSRNAAVLALVALTGCSSATPTSRSDTRLVFDSLLQEHSRHITGGDIAGIVILIEISLPALKQRVDAGESIQPAWQQFIERLTERYGLPSPPRARPLRSSGPLATLVLAYRS